MPTAVPAPSDFYASHGHRQSSQSQTDLANQVQRSRVYSPNQSQVLLPATTYNQLPQATHNRGPSFSNNLSRVDTSVSLPSTRERDTQQQISADPDDFYRSTLTAPNLHQDALRATVVQGYSQSGGGSNDSHSTNWSAEESNLYPKGDEALPRNTPGLRGRKASVKNLVAQINASSTEEVPPVPTQPLSNTIPIRNVSPSLSAYASPSVGAGTRKFSSSTIPNDIDPRTPTRDDSQQRRPLFGEVIPNNSQSRSAGYGILNPRRRAGSESSPMHSPNPMFPHKQRDSRFVLSSARYSSSEQRPEHRRTNSDLPRSPYQDDRMVGRGDMLIPPVSGRRPPAISRIPVSTRRLSTNSDSGGSTPNSRAASSLDKRQANNDSKTTSARIRSPNSSLSVEQPSRRKITSPGRRGKALDIPQASLHTSGKGPSLRANIIVPPHKTSPPLRSSRPRVPISNASTAASRARMAEKFDAMQKLNNEKRASQRRPLKPPELTDIDLKARRLRITQALTRSLESEDLKGNFHIGRRWEPSRSRTTSPRPAVDMPDDLSSSIPDLHVADADGEMGMPQRDDSFDTQGVDKEYATHIALQAMRLEDARSLFDVDSPIRGHDEPFEKPIMQLQTNFLHHDISGEPGSAVTIATEATDIDPEPQENTRPSLLSHVLEMRDKSPSGQLDHSSQSADDYFDRADVESVNLVLRNTAYLDDDEAIRTGYMPSFVTENALPEGDEVEHQNRDSWTSSIHDEVDAADDPAEHENHSMQNAHGIHENGEEQLRSSEYQQRDDSYRETMASDAYTIINIVLQEHSSSGIVDQQFADDLYQRVLEVCPEVGSEENYDSEKIEQLCLQEISRREENEHSAFTDEALTETDEIATTPQRELSRQIRGQVIGNTEASEPPVANGNLLTLPSTVYHGHHYKSSLGSAKDWAETSPSVGDWMRFASDRQTSSEGSQTGEPAPEQDKGKEPEVQFEADTVETNSEKQRASTATPQIVSLDMDENLEPEEYGTAIIRAPSRSPPPPPKDIFSSIDQTSLPAGVESLESRVRKPRVPQRVTSLSQMQYQSQSQAHSRPASTRSRAEIVPWEVQEQPGPVLSPEARKFKQRKHVLKELVDTEFTYQRDMRVLCDIYKPTALAALTEDDIRVLFGNIEQVQQFARDFLTALKQTAKPSYLMDRTDRKRDKTDGLEDLTRNSSSSTLASTKVESDATDMQRDMETRVGDAFEGFLADMESVYTEYIRNRHAANQKLEALQKSPPAQEWLKECRDNSSDITNAWNLDALLVKPVQRITKYPLLLKELIDATADGHPDLSTLRRAIASVTDVNIRINEVKKHAEMLDQVLNRKRGQSDVRTGLSKAFGRRAEKLRQHVGITDMYEDPEYDKLRIDYDNNYVHLMLVADDLAKYERGITQWVNRMVDIAAAMEGWVDVGHSHHQQEESKLRHLAMIIRNVNSIALPDHVEHLRKKVIQPMTKTVDVLIKFKDDPKGLLSKRDKRLVDYAQMKNKKERGEKVDRKMAERMDQWEALNTEAKERMRKLLRATAHLVQTCQGHLIQLQMSWMAMIQQKFSSVMGINLNHLSPEEMERDWQVDFDYQEASALALGICNGSLMMQAANMTSFLTPGSTTLNGDDSPRQMSLASTNKRSISLHSESSQVPTLDFGSRPSGTYSGHTLGDNHFDRAYSYANGRTRAASTASGKSLRVQDLSTRSATNAKHASASANFARPGTSPGIAQEAFAPPRLSVETHTPLMSSLQVQTLPDRPVSTSTFFSAAAGPSQVQGPQRSAASSVFSSALPMSDSPIAERHAVDIPGSEPQILFTTASVYEFNIDRARREAGFPYLTYVTGEIFDVIGERGELWLAKNQDDPQKQIGWIWNKHFAKLAE